MSKLITETYHDGIKRIWVVDSVKTPRSVLQIVQEEDSGDADAVYQFSVVGGNTYSAVSGYASGEYYSVNDFISDADIIDAEDIFKIKNLWELMEIEYGMGEY